MALLIPSGPGHKALNKACTTPVTAQSQAFKTARLRSLAYSLLCINMLAGPEWWNWRL